MQYLVFFCFLFLLYNAIILLLFLLYYAIEIQSQIETTPNKEKHKVESVNMEYESNNNNEIMDIYYSILVF